MQEGEELFEEALFAFGGELVAETPEAAAEEGAEGIGGCVGGHPVRGCEWGVVY